MDKALFEDRINKFANTWRMIGIVLVMCSAVGAISYRSNGMQFWDSNTIFLLLLFTIGVVLIIVCEYLWRLILKYGDSETRLFHFKDD